MGKIGENNTESQKGKNINEKKRKYIFLIPVNVILSYVCLWIHIFTGNPQLIDLTSLHLYIK